ncbi:MAG: hypothetical protein ACTSPQ_20175 [Candidatus Helarchaeota archaeon]
MFYFRRGENQQEIEKLLLFFKKELSVPPKSITVDYKPTWDNANNNKGYYSLILFLFIF